MNEPWLALMAVTCNVFAQVAMKFSGKAGLSAAGISGWLTPWLLLAVALYGASFLLTMKVFAVNSLSIASPLMAGLTFALVALASYFLLGESFGVLKIVGLCFIGCGILMLTRS